MNPYLILKVDVRADFKSIGKAFKRMSLYCHPDKGGSNAAMRILLEARNIIGDPVSRFIWDKYKDVTLRREREYCGDIQEYLMQLNGLTRQFLTCLTRMIRILSLWRRKTPHPLPLRGGESPVKGETEAGGKTEKRKKIVKLFKIQK